MATLLAILACLAQWLAQQHFPPPRTGGAL